MRECQFVGDMGFAFVLFIFAGRQRKSGDPAREIEPASADGLPRKPVSSETHKDISRTKIVKYSYIWKGMR